MRLIDADELIEKAWDVPFETENAHFVQVVDVGDIMSAPTISPDSLRPKGRWTLNRDGSGTCSECHRTRTDVWDMDNWDNYCSHCGADMRG